MPKKIIEPEEGLTVFERCCPWKEGKEGICPCLTRIISAEEYQREMTAQMKQLTSAVLENNVTNLQLLERQKINSTWFKVIIGVLVSIFGILLAALISLASFNISHLARESQEITQAKNTSGGATSNSLPHAATSPWLNEDSFRLVVYPN